ncbi:MAG: Ig-like domain-containing protein [Spirosomataceae bacterium]
MKNSFTYIQTILQPRLAKRQFASLGLFSFVLLTLLVGFVPKASAQCDFQPNTPITFQATGGNTAANYVNQYLLTNDLGTILEVASSPSFTGKPAGVYIIYTINYETTSTVTGNQVGGKISQVTGDCLDISAPLAISVCSLNEVCDFSQTQSISFNAAGGNTDPAYTNLYALTDFAGVIVQTSLSPSFSAQTAGVYLVFNINYLTSEGITNASVGQSITNVTGNCFAISDPLAIHVCQFLNLLTATNDAANVTAGLSAPIAILANDRLNGNPVQRADINAPTITVQPTKGTVVVNADGTLTYTANANATGTDTFTYQICLASEPTNCATAQVTMSIADAPIANVLTAANDAANVTAGLSAPIAILANDRLNGNPVQRADINAPTITVQPTQGTVVVNADGTLTYTANANATGTDTFIYQICLASEPTNCATAQVTMSIADAPIANVLTAANDAANVTAGLSAPIAILANDRLNGNPVQRADINAPTITVQPTKGTVVVNADGTLTYTANANATGTDTFT